MLSAVLFAPSDVRVSAITDYVRSLAAVAGVESMGVTNWNKLAISRAEVTCLASDPDVSTLGLGIFEPLRPCANGRHPPRLALGFPDAQRHPWPPSLGRARQTRGDQARISCWIPQDLGETRPGLSPGWQASSVVVVCVCGGVDPHSERFRALRPAVAPFPGACPWVAGGSVEF